MWCSSLWAAVFSYVTKPCLQRKNEANIKWEKRQSYWIFTFNRISFLWIYKFCMQKFKLGFTIYKSIQRKRKEWGMYRIAIYNAQVVIELIFRNQLRFQILIKGKTSMQNRHIHDSYIDEFWTTLIWYSENLKQKSNTVMMKAENIKMKELVKELKTRK